MNLKLAVLCCVAPVSLLCVGGEHSPLVARLVMEHRGGSMSPRLGHEESDGRAVARRDGLQMVLASMVPPRTTHPDAALSLKASTTGVAPSKRAHLAVIPEEGEPDAG